MRTITLILALALGLPLDAARTFSGSGQYLDLGSAALLSATGEWTVAIRVLPGSSGAGAVIFSQYIGAAGNGRMVLRLAEAGAANVQLFLGNDATLTSQNVTGPPISAAAWSLVAATRSGADFAVYVDTSKTTHTDASAARSILQTGCLLAARTNSSGAYNASLDAFWAGQLAEAAVWSVQLSDAEIASLAAGVPALLVRPQSLTFYAPLVRSLNELRTVRTITATGATVSDHPRVLGRD
jgi:hypothetical protein